MMMPNSRKGEQSSKRKELFPNIFTSPIDPIMQSDKLMMKVTVNK